MNTAFIKDTVFKTVDFTYDKDIEFGEFDGVKVEFDGENAKLSSNTKAGLARACFLFAMNISEGKKNFSIEEKPRFNDCGIMLDCSRNAVMTVPALKKYINCMASIGMNYLMLYTEDTYEIEGRPLFGYLRGRYTTAELQEVDNYAESMGVELVPCIQTLGHLEQYIKWGRDGAPDYTGEGISEIRNSDQTAFVGEGADETYRFIEDAIRACRKAFKTKRIHIGMDEAPDIAMGKYFKKHGVQPKFEAMLDHLNRVYEICKKYDFKPMMWSDMFFRLKTGGAYYRYDFNFDKEIGERAPDVEQMYWDYYHDDPELYDGMFARHMELGKTISFAGGIVTFYGFVPVHEYSYKAATTAMRSCLKYNIKTVVNTLWGDDGNETNAFLANPLLPVYTEYCYKGEDCTEEDIKRVSEYFTKIKFEDTALMGRLTFDIGDTLVQGRRMFYSDVMYDLGNREENCDEFIAKYSESRDRMKELMNLHDKNEETYRYAYLLYAMVTIKSELRKNLRNAYQSGNKTYLEKALSEYLPELLTLTEEFAKVHKKQWYSTYKPNGFEVLNYRYGGLTYRIKDAIETLDEYLSGKISEIPQLAEKIVINEEDYAAPTPRLVTPSTHL